MSRVIKNDAHGARTVSEFVDLDGVQVLITLRTVEGRIGAELRFRTGPGQDFSEPIELGDDLPG